ncbi:MAG: ammonium transporter [Deltaproteobacteria bacterium]|jgi:Amt family ammonium transporter|nr:ammonium transporter [Deltaproteobacteria bacterium]
MNLNMLKNFKMPLSPLTFIWSLIGGLSLVLFSWVSPVFADGSKVPAFSAGNTAWVLASTALVLIMTPGLGFYYGGMVRRKNVLNTISLSFITICTVSVIWILWGYSLAFGPDAFGGIIGNFKYLGLFAMKEVQHSRYDGTIPSYIYVMFQLMFAIITVALVSGSLVERIKFSSWVVFTIVWLTLVYAPIAQAVWGLGGLFQKMGALDFAGGTVVHIDSGVAGLAGALVLGKRKGYMKENIVQPNQLGYTILGGALLWFGWFGFNAGSALEASPLATSAFLVTNTATAAAALGWMIAEWIRSGKPTTLGMVSGAVAGLVAITPASGFVNPIASIIIGFVAGVICYSMVVYVKPKLGYDDALDAFNVHAIGGAWGALATGLFADPLINSAGRGLFYGNPGQMWVQFLTVITVAAYSFTMSYIIFKVIDKVMGLRVDKETESIGLDITQHDEAGYNF